MSTQPCEAQWSVCGHAHEEGLCAAWLLYRNVLLHTALLSFGGPSTCLPPRVPSVPACDNVQQTVCSPAWVMSQTYAHTLTAALLPCFTL